MPPSLSTKNIPSNFDVIGRWVVTLFPAEFYEQHAFTHILMRSCVHNFSMMMNKMNQSRRENVKVDINLEMHTYHSFDMCIFKRSGRAGDFNQRDREPQCNQHWFGTIFVTDQISTCNAGAIRRVGILIS